MNDTENPDHEDRDPNTDSKPPVPVFESHNQRVLRKANSHRAVKDKEPAERRIREWLQIATNVTLVIVGIFAVCIYGGQLKVMRGQLGEIVKQYPEVQKQAKASQDSVAEVERQTRLDQRPWIKFQSGGPSPDRSFASAIGQPLRVPIRFINIGKTAALRVKGMIIVEIVPMGKDPPIPNDIAAITAEGQASPPRSYFIKKIPGTQYESSIVYPGDPADTIAIRSKFIANGRIDNPPFTLEEAKSFQGGKLYLAIWGEIWYFDIFGIEHWTKFCSLANSGGNPIEGEKCAKFGGVDNN
jgi:uncharacterized protein YhhL (DUF1145 family)